MYIYIYIYICISDLFLFLSIILDNYYKITYLLITV